MKSETVAHRIVERIQNCGAIAYFVGGYVRDSLLGVPSQDIDIVSSLRPEELANLFEKTIPVGIHFGILIIVEEGYSFEVAMFRKEGPYLDGRRPIEVLSGTPEEDARRRDFTINALFFDPVRSELFDFVGAQADLDLKLIRAIGNPLVRFQEDRLRMLRAVRYATKWSFKIDPGTEEAIKEESSSLFPSVSKERVWQELDKMNKGGHLVEGLAEMQRLGLLPVLFPPLKGESREEITSRLKIEHSLPTALVLYLLLKELKQEEALRWISSLKIDNTSLQLFAFAQKLPHLFSSKEKRLDLYTHPYFDPCLPLLSKEQQEEACKEIFFHKEIIQRKKEGIRAVSAEALMKRGIQKGSKLGELLQRAEELSFSLRTNDPELILPILLAEQKSQD